MPSSKIVVASVGSDARHLAADVGHVAEHRGLGDQPAVLEHRQQHQPVVAMADRAVAANRGRTVKNMSPSSTVPS